MSWDKVNKHRQELTDKIISELEKGIIPWHKPWVTPFNPVTGNVYNGGNRLGLAMVSMEKGYTDPRWCTYLQAQQNNWQVKPGEKASYIEFWQWTEKKPVLDDKGSPVMDSNGKPKTETVHLDKPRCRVYPVFNAQQIEGMPELTLMNPTNTIERAEAIVKNSGISIQQDVSITQACYILAKDLVKMPDKAFFKNMEGYYGTLLHEIAHATGHRSRLNRELNIDDRSYESYAKEELRAELASCFLNHELGTTKDYTETAAYIQSWIKVLKEDKSEIFRAAYDADKIADYILEFDPQKEKTVENETEKVSQIRSATPEIESNGQARTDIRINVPYDKKEMASKLGAEYEGELKTWYIPKGSSISEFNDFLPPDGSLPVLKDTPLSVPFEEKDNIKGDSKVPQAEWDKEKKQWYLPAGRDANLIPPKYFQSPHLQKQVLPEKSFEEFAAEKGLLIEGPVIADGKLHRVPVDGGKKGSKDGAYLLHDDGNGRAGYVQNFKTGEKSSFGEKLTEKVLTPKNKEELEAIKAEREKEIKAGQDKVAGKVKYLVEKVFRPATNDHPYLINKGVKAFGALVDKENTLIIPLTNINGELRSFQRIQPDGQKGFISGSQKSGCFYIMGNMESSKANKIYICEGFATAASVHDATNRPVVCAFDASNLKSVAEAIREKYGNDLEIVIAGDNDHSVTRKIINQDGITEEIKVNPGKEHAEAAAKACGGKALIPQFNKKELEAGLTDFNDLANSRGKFEVVKQLEGSREKKISPSKEIELAV